MRDNNFLRERFLKIYQEHFADFKLRNKIILKFGRSAKTRLGSIKLNSKKQSVITINGLFRSEEVPLFVIDGTLAHEFVHYMHGFNSEIDCQFQHPHRGGIVDKELIKRGFREILMEQKIWLKREWPKAIRNSELGIGEK
ncbi:MAG: hypothetical protein PHU71_04040 [Candidatus Gracilibacteria bacterium]|nr:hypothetical protein [Candidatus Gracilibacteria bacterium]